MLVVTGPRLNELNEPVLDEGDNPIIEVVFEHAQRAVHPSYYKEGQQIKLQAHHEKVRYGHLLLNVPEVTIDGEALDADPVVAAEAVRDWLRNNVGGFNLADPTTALPTGGSGFGGDAMELNTAEFDCWRFETAGTRDAVGPGTAIEVYNATNDLIIVNPGGVEVEATSGGKLVKDATSGDWSKFMASILLLLSFVASGFAQQVEYLPMPTAPVEAPVVSTQSEVGILSAAQLQSYTTAERDALQLTANERRLIWNLDNQQIEQWDGATWGPIGQGEIELSTEPGQIATLDSQGRILVREGQPNGVVFKNVVPEVANIPGNATGVFSTPFTPLASGDYVFEYSGDLQSGTAGISVGTTVGGTELFVADPASGDADGSRLTLTRQANFTPPIPLTAGVTVSITQWVGGGGHIINHTVCGEAQAVDMTVGHNTPSRICEQTVVVLTTSIGTGVDSTVVVSEWNNSGVTFPITEGYFNISTDPDVAGVAGTRITIEDGQTVPIYLVGWASRADTGAPNGNTQLSGIHYSITNTGGALSGVEVAARIDTGFVPADANTMPYNALSTSNPPQRDPDVFINGAGFSSITTETGDFANLQLDGTYIRDSDGSVLTVGEALAGNWVPCVADGGATISLIHTGRMRRASILAASENSADFSTLKYTDTDYVTGVIADPATGRFTITQSGRYELFGVLALDSVDNSNDLALVVSVGNGAPTGEGVLSSFDAGGDVDAPILSGKTELDLIVGQTVQIGLRDANLTTALSADQIESTDNGAIFSIRQLSTHSVIDTASLPTAPQAEWSDGDTGVWNATAGRFEPADATRQIAALQNQFDVDSTVLTTIPDLQFDVKADERWVFEVNLLAESLDATADLRAGTVAPAGSTGRIAFVNAENATVRGADINDATLALVVATGTDDLIQIKGIVNAAADGVVQFQLRNNTGTVLQSFRADSWVEAHKLAN